MSLDKTQFGHGHVVPREDGVKARCGGPGMCKVCQGEQGLVDLLKSQLLAATQPEMTAYLLSWAVERWRAEVQFRPPTNVHRRLLDSTWRQVIRKLGGDDRKLVGPMHDELLELARFPKPDQQPPTGVQEGR